MARLPRFVLPGHPQHVIQRGNNREAIFHETRDYRFFLEKLAQAGPGHGCDIHAYVLMTNHLHLLVTPREEAGIGQMMQSLGRVYVQRFNQSYGRSGTLWEGRYRATLIETESYLLTCMRYIELNPVRAGMVAHPREFPWSSYRCNALGGTDPIVRPHALYRRLGTTATGRQAAYRQLFKDRIPQGRLDLIRAATNKSWVLGDARFRARMAKRLDRPVAPKPRGGDRKSAAYRTAQQINRV